MQPLKEVWILQKIKRLILPKRIKAMENIFGNIELIPIDSNFYQPTLNLKQPEIPKPKQFKSPVLRHTIDYQQAKRRTQCIKQIQQLKNTIKESQQKNQLLYNRIISLTPDFAYVLFQSKNYQNENYGNFDQIKLLEQKLMSELDKLYEENCLLEKQLNRVKFVEQTQEKLKFESLHQNINHYQFLRNVWHHQNQKNQKQQPNKCEDIIEKLNKKVATVKFSINHILKEEQSNQNNNTLSHQIQNDFIVRSSKYQKLLKLYEQASMQLQEQRSRFWSEAEKSKKEELVYKLNGQQNAQIQNLNLKIKQLEAKAYESQQQIKFLKDQLTAKERQLLKQKNNQSNLQYIFYDSKGEKTNDVGLQKGIQIRVYNLMKNDIHNVQNYKIDSNLDSFILMLKTQGKLMEENVNYNSSLNLYLQKISAFQNEKSISLRKSLNDADMNRIKTDRLSLIKKTNKLTETLNGSNTLRRNVSRERQLRVSKTSLQEKQNTGLIPFIECYKEGSIYFPSEVSSINFETDFKAKFVRTTNRNRAENHR